MSTTTEDTVTVDDQIRDFYNAVEIRRAKHDLINRYHVAMINQNAAYKMPYSDGDRSIYLTQYLPWSEDDENSGNTIDVDKTNSLIAAVIKAATALGYRVEKKYDDDNFVVTVHLDDEKYGNKVNYTANRKSVCSPKVVGKEIIPAKEVDIIEWDCNKISFLAM